MSQKEEPTFSFKAQVAVAIIGLLGSLGGAWIASGAKFDRELDSRGEEIRRLRDSLLEAQKTLDEQKESLLEAQKTLDEQKEKLDKIDQEIETAKKMAMQIAAKAADITWEKVKTSLPSFPFSRGAAKE